jgi:hypothetical protein
MLGEIRTSLAQTSTALPDDDVAALLDLLPGRSVRRISRPIPYAASPERFTGVDCALALPSRATVRAVGTVGHYTIVTGGHLIQGSAAVALSRRPDGRRRPWSHYLARPGRVEITGKGEPNEIAAAFLDDRTQSGAQPLLDLGAVADQAIDSPQEEFTALDRRPPLRTPRGRLRWAMISGAGRPSVRIRLQDGAIRSVLLRLPPDSDVEAARAFCEDLARHDWLLTTVDNLVRQAGIGRLAPAAVVNRLRPAIDHLLHLWSPDARRTPSTALLWSAVEEATGLDRQWQLLIQRIRDQLFLPASFEPTKEHA